MEEISARLSREDCERLKLLVARECQDWLLSGPPRNRKGRVADVCRELPEGSRVIDVDGEVKLGLTEVSFIPGEKPAEDCPGYPDDWEYAQEYFLIDPFGIGVECWMESFCLSEFISEMRRDILDALRDEAEESLNDSITEMELDRAEWDLEEDVQAGRISA